MSTLTAIMSAVLCCALGQTAPAGDIQGYATASDLVALVHGNNAFAAELHDRLPAEKGNLFFCPYSLHTAMGMMLAGARQETESQLSGVMGVSPSSDRVHPAVAALVKKLTADAKVSGGELCVSNALWGQKGYGLSKDFLLIAGDHYGAALSEVDFESVLRPAGKGLNAWCDKHTGGTIKELVRGTNLAPKTHLVLTNVVRYSSAPAPAGKTLGPRAAASRRLRPFDLPAAVRPPFSDDQSVIIFMTKIGDDQAHGATTEPARWRRTSDSTVAGSFEIRSEFRLRGILEGMKLTDAFSKSADFSGFNGWKDLRVVEVIHKADVKVTPEGTEAVAATAVIIDISGRDPVFVAGLP
jgi:serpin B